MTLVRTFLGRAFLDTFNRPNNTIVGRNWNETVRGGQLSRIIDNELASANSGTPGTELIYQEGDAGDLNPMPSGDVIVQINMDVTTPAFGHRFQHYLRTDEIVSTFGSEDAYLAFYDKNEALELQIHKMIAGVSVLSNTLNFADTNDLRALRFILDDQGSQNVLTLKLSGILASLQDQTVPFTAASLSLTDSTSPIPFSGDTTDFALLTLRNLLSDHYLMFRRNIVVNGLPSGWKGQVGTETAVVESGGVATIDIDSVEMPQSLMKVLDGGDVQQDSLLLTEEILGGDVWGGDIYKFTPDPPIVIKGTGSGWVEGDSWHYIAEGTTAEWKILGTFVANQPTARIGSLWVEGDDFHYIDENQDERFVAGTLIETGVAGRPGSLWIGGAFWRWLSEPSPADHRRGIGATLVDVTDPAPEVQSVTSVSFDGTSGPLVFDHPVAGEDRVLYLFVCTRDQLNDGVAVAPVTYDGVACTFLSSSIFLGANPRVDVWRLIAPNTGTNPVSIALTGAINKGVVVAAVSLTNVDQTTPEGTIVVANGSTPTPIVNVASAADELVIDAVACVADLLLGPEQVQLFGNEVDEVFAAGSREAGAVTVPMTWSTTPAPTNWATLGIPVKPV